MMSDFQLVASIITIMLFIAICMLGFTYFIYTIVNLFYRWQFVKYRKSRRQIRAINRGISYSEARGILKYNQYVELLRIIEIELDKIKD